MARAAPCSPETLDGIALIGRFPAIPGARQIMLFDIDSVQTSCGYAVPEYDLKSERQILRQWAEKKSPDELKAYQAGKKCR